MSRSRLAVALLIFPLLASAQTADLAVSMEAPTESRPGEVYTFTATVVNNGPDAAANVRLWMDATSPGQCYSNEGIGTMAPAERRHFSCSIPIPLTGLRSYRLFPWVSVLSETRDPDAVNNGTSSTAHILTPADLRGTLHPPSPLVPGLPATMYATYVNVAHTAASNATLTVRGDVEFVTAPEGCSIAPGVVVCDVGRVDPSGHEAVSLPITFIAPDVSARLVEFEGDIAGREPDPAPDDNAFRASSKTWKTFFVTHTADRGEGSLRTAMANASAQCLDSWPCLVAFRIPPGGEAWHTIRPLTPLPALMGLKITIDGSLQDAYFGDTNPAGPEIELSGSELQEGYGLRVFGDCEAVIRGLAINRFPYDGLLVGQSAACPPSESGGSRLVDRNFVGTDPTGSHPEPNSRGIHLTSGRWTVQRNLVSGNRRSGIIVARGPSSIIGNTIGLNPALTADLGNGASGVYVEGAGSGTDVSHNSIGFNRHFGVAIAADSQNVALFGNSFQANHQMAIDWGLDGLSLTPPVAVPEIVDARFENGETVIEVRPGEVGGNFLPKVQIYANDAPDPSGFGEGQYFLGETSRDTDGRYVLRYPADLRGKWIAATNTRTVFDTSGLFTTTSEFGRAVEVR